MDLQIPQDKLEDDVTSAPEKDLSSPYTMLLDYNSRFMGHYDLANYGISCPQHNHLLRALGEYPQNHCKALNESKLHSYVNIEKQMSITGNKFSLENNKPPVVLHIDLMEPSQRHIKKITSQLQDNSTVCNLNKHKHKHKENMPRYPMFQHKRKEIAQLVSFVVAASIMFLGLFSDMWIRPLHKERGPVSTWASLLGLFGFMVFVWAVAITILVGVPFSRMQSSVLIFWAILMHLKSAGSISAVLVPMLGIIFLGVFGRGKF